MDHVRCKIEDNKLWFPVVDITKYSKDGKNLHRAATRWLKNNLSGDGFRKLKVGGTVSQKGGLLLCVNSDNLRIVGMYESHLRSGKDFRAKWADLPDTPSFPSETKKELSWRNLYAWSKTEHRKNSGLCDSHICELRRVASIISERFDIKSPEKIMSFREAVAKLGLVG